MEKRFYFGKIAYAGKLPRESVEVTIRYEKKEKGYVFSATGDIWNCNHSDIYCGGQCLDTIAEYIDNPVFREIHELWKLYHLNDMHAECVHQAELGWQKLANKEVLLHTFMLKNEVFTSQRKLEKCVVRNAIMGDAPGLTEEERKVLGLKISITSHMDVLPEDVTTYYKHESSEKKTLGWLRESEHPEGLLCRPCPVCGYRYGTSWNFFEIPDVDKQRIERLMSAETPSIQYRR